MPVDGIRDTGLRKFEDVARRRILRESRELFPQRHIDYVASIKVTLLISLSVVSPILALSNPDSRSDVMPSSRALRRISDAGRLSRISSRIGSLKSSNSVMALRPRNPVPPHSKHPGPS